MEDWIRAIESAVGVKLHAERDHNDSDYNQVIIEFKNKGLFHGSVNSHYFKVAKEELFKYIYAKANKEGLNPDNYIGITTDGEYIAFAHIAPDSKALIVGPLLKFSEETTALVFDAVKASSRRVLSSDNLIEDFGHNSENGSDMMQALSIALNFYLDKIETNKIKMLYQEWKALYGQVANLSVEQIKSVKKKIGIDLGGSDDALSRLLFVIHTYNSIIIKFLAAELISQISEFTTYTNFSQNLLNYKSDKFFEMLDMDIEHAKLYDRQHIHGFVEEPLFSWYIDVCRMEMGNSYSTHIERCIKNILGKLSYYKMDDLSHAQTNDILKNFYQNLVPTVLRKSLGEFYTPDWLVGTCLKQVRHSFSDLRFLDPCCGSGSFLLAIIRKIRIEDHGDAKTTLHRILNNVWGFDLNPLAVQTARVNYLIAIADLIKKVPGTDIEIPILLADAIYSPAPDPMMGSKFVYYEIGSHIANLQIVLPAELASDRRLLDNVFALMEKCVENNMSPNLICDALVEQGILNRDEIGSWKEALETTYSHVLSLHKRKWNGIWFRIVRNYFWSSAAGHFDVIVGNPPWVRWSKLPKLYQQRVMPTCEKYDIFAKTKYFGGNELDISGLITYTVADKWLSEGGKLIFLITQTHFQSASSSGFRKFKLKPLLVEDMKELKPFADAANKTALFVGIKSEDSPSYPIKYIIWKKKDGFSARIPENLSSDEVSMRTIHVDYEANPVGDLSTPWAILPKGDFKLLKKLMGTCSWIEGKKGITTDLNGVYFVKILQYSEDSRLVQIETRPEAGKTDIGPKQKFWVEPDLLYPVIKGAGQISCCGYTQLEDLAVIVPNNGILREDYLVSWEQMNKQYPHLLEYFTNFKALLANRSTYRTRMPNAPFYAVYNVGQYTFEPWKVIWAEQPGKDKFPVSVIHTQRFLGREDKVVIPDHKVYFASFSDSEHAYYLCGLLLNSTVVTYLNSFQIKVQVGDIFKHLKLPEMNSTNEMHQELISLTRMAHKEEDIFRKETLLNKISSLAGKIIF